METHKREPQVGWFQVACHKPVQGNDMPAEPIEVKSGWIRLKLTVGAATGTMWVRGEDIARISTISMPGVPGNPGTSQVEVNRGQDGPLLVDHSPAEIIEAIKSCERAAGNDQPEIKCSSLCECNACKIKYLQAEVTDLKSDIEYLQTSKNALLAKMDDLRGRLALIRSAARALQTEKPTPDLSEGEGLQPDGSYVIKVRLGESSLCAAQRHPNVMQVEKGGVAVKPGHPGRVVRIISG